MFFYPIFDQIQWGTYDIPGDWSAFTHILSYGSDFLAVDANGDMWLFSDGTAKKVGRGWNKYQLITAFGDNLLALVPIDCLMYPLTRTGSGT